MDRGPKLAGVVHGVCRRLLDVGIAAGVYRFHAMKGVLKIGGGNQHRIDVLASIKLVVVADRIDGISTELLYIGSALFAASVPYIGDRDKLEVHILGVLQESGNQCAFHSIAATNNAHSHAVVRADNCRIAGCVPRDSCCGKGHAARLQKRPAVVIFEIHVSPRPVGLSPKLCWLKISDFR